MDDGSRVGVADGRTVGPVGYSVGEVDGPGIGSIGAIVRPQLRSLVGKLVISFGVGATVGAASAMVGNVAATSMTSRPPKERGFLVDANSSNIRSAASAGSPTARMTDPDTTSICRMSEVGTVAAAAMPSRIKVKSRPSTEPLRTK